MSITIEHDAALGRFSAHVHGHLCVCDYRLRDGVMVMTHTEVAPELEGQGIAAELVRAALAHAREHGLKVRPLCSYVQAYMRRHPEVQSLLS
jgi:predicted GNAT family acetyltransferase